LYLNGAMTCVCDQSTFTPFVEMVNNNINYCCPVGATIINGACGCSSSGSTKAYAISVG